jgi:hypothetical protein
MWVGCIIWVYQSLVSRKGLGVAIEVSFTGCAATVICGVDSTAGFSWYRTGARSVLYPNVRTDAAEQSAVGSGFQSTQDVDMFDHLAMLKNTLHSEKCGGCTTFLAMRL